MKVKESFLIINTLINFTTSMSAKWTCSGLCSVTAAQAVYREDRHVFGRGQKRCALGWWRVDGFYRRFVQHEEESNVHAAQTAPLALAASATRQYGPALRKVRAQSLQLWGDQRGGRRGGWRVPDYSKICRVTVPRRTQCLWQSTVVTRRDINHLP